jgi:alpha-L-fucosidase
VYVHILDKPENPGFIFIPELKADIGKAFLFKGKKEVKFKQQPEGTFIYLDGIQLDDTDTIIQMELK